MRKGVAGHHRIALCAGYSVEIEEFGKAREEWFRRFLELPNGMTPLVECLRCWTRNSSPPVSRTGYARSNCPRERCHRREDPAGLRRVHMVSAWASENRMVLGQTRTEAPPTRLPQSRNC